MQWACQAQRELLNPGRAVDKPDARLELGTASLRHMG